MNKKELSERDICTKYITPSIKNAGWDISSQIREEFGFTDGRIYVQGKLHTRGAQKLADYILFYKPEIPIAVNEAKDNSYTVEAIMASCRKLDTEIKHSHDYVTRLLQAVLKDAFIPAT